MSTLVTDLIYIGGHHDFLHDSMAGSWFPLTEYRTVELDQKVTSAESSILIFLVKPAMPCETKRDQTIMEQFVNQLKMYDRSTCDDDRITKRAIGRTVSHLFGAYAKPIGEYVEGDLYPDGEGGIRVLWEHGDRQVRLSIHATDPREDYLYHENGDDYAVETEITTDLLHKWLGWLSSNN